MRSLTALVFLALAGACSAPPRADLVLRGGPIHTQGPEGTVEAVAVAQGVFVYVGSESGVQAWIGPSTRVVDLAGGAALPGLADAHLHLLGLSDLLAELDLVGTESFEQVVAEVAERAAQVPPGTWITGRGWDQNDWPEGRFPHHAALTAAVPKHPVALRRIDGHALLVNGSALEAAGLLSSSADPPGGRILRDDLGAPTGVLIDNAMGAVTRQLPAVTPEQRRQRVIDAVRFLHERGITAVHDAGVSVETVELYADMARAGELPLRVAIMLAGVAEDLESAAAARGWPTDDLTGQDLISVRMIKLSVDGALGSRGAALLEPYADEPHSRGLFLLPPGLARERVRFALEHGWQMAIHAIGDGANRHVLDLYAAELDRQPVADHRFRIEHAQILAPEDVSRFAALGVIPSVQAQHQTSDWPWVRERLGEAREAGAYVWRGLLNSGVILAGGSDAPVESVDVGALLRAAVTRRDDHGQPPGGWHAEQAMTLDEALSHITLWPAVASFWEDRIGSIEPGKEADLVVLDADPYTVAPHALADLAVRLTVFDGQIVFDASGEPP